MILWRRHSTNQLSSLDHIWLVEILVDGGERSHQIVARLNSSPTSFEPGEADGGPKL